MILKNNSKKTGIKSSGDVAKIIDSILECESEIDRDKEHLFVIGLTSQNSIKYIELVSLGTLDQSLCSPREVFRLAISQGVKSIIMVHNHPSGLASPSIEDKWITEKIKKSGDIIDIKLLDHIIVTNKDGGYYSFADTCLLS